MEIQNHNFWLWSHHDLFSFPPGVSVEGAVFWTSSFCSGLPLYSYSKWLTPSSSGNLLGSKASNGITIIHDKFVKCLEITNYQIRSIKFPDWLHQVHDHDIRSSIKPAYLTLMQPEHEKRETPDAIRAQKGTRYEMVFSETGAGSGVSQDENGTGGIRVKPRNSFMPRRNVCCH